MDIQDIGRWLWFHTRISNDSINSCDIYNVCCSYHSDGWILKYKTFSEINLLSIPEYRQCAFQDGSNVLKLCLMWKHFILKGSQNRYLHYSFELTQSYLKEHNEFILIKIKKEFDANFFPIPPILKFGRNYIHIWRATEVCELTVDTFNSINSTQICIMKISIFTFAHKSELNE